MREKMVGKLSLHPTESCNKSRDSKIRRKERREEKKLERKRFRQALENDPMLEEYVV